VEFDQVKAHAHFTVIDAMDLALLTGQRPADVLKLKRTDIRDGALWTVQNKTGQHLGIEITGELAAVNARINERPRQAISAYLIQDDNGQSLTQFALRSRFDKARTLAKVDFQFRDIRAKAATDTGDLPHSQTLLGHKNRDMTEHCVRSRTGGRAKPLRWLRNIKINLNAKMHNLNPTIPYFFAHFPTFHMRMFGLSKQNV
jgi:integrase